MKTTPFFAVILLLSLFTGCTHEADFGGQKWKNLTKATAERDAITLISLSVSGDDSLRNQAYRSLVHTPLNKSQVDEIIFRRENPFRWFALSRQDLQEEQLAELRKRLKKSSSDQQQWLSYTLGKQADSLSYLILTDILNQQPSHPHTYQLAHSASEILYQFDFPDSLSFRLIPLVSHSDFEVQESALYGFYRALPSKVVSDSNWDEVFNQLIADPGYFSPYARQMLFAIGFTYQPQNMNTILKKISVDDELISAQLTILRNIAQVEDADLHEKLVLHGLNHPNDHLYIAALRSLDDFSTKMQQKAKVIVEESAKQNESILRKFESVRLLQRMFGDIDIDRKTYWNHLRDYPLHSDIIISILEHDQNAYSFLGQLLNRYRSFPALAQMSLNEKVLDLYKTLPKPERDNAVDFLQNHVEYLFSEAKADRGVYYTFSSWLSEPYIMDRSLRLLISKRLLKLDPIADIEVYQSLLPDLFPEINSDWQHRMADHLLTKPSPAVIDLLSELKEDSELEITLPKLSSKDKPHLHTPNFARISVHQKDGVVLQLTTEKGEIEINLDVSRAPATVSMIDSLARNGFYDGVPFHRVIPDFVAQGGDFERGDGFGGGTEMIPTEPSELSFLRGAFGMASAGADTESSQFFIMHSWKPHLDGRYTNFGMVTKGMNVVDSIVKGDKILSAEIVEM